jgi:hypothetical protein
VIVQHPLDHEPQGYSTALVAKLKNHRVSLLEGFHLLAFWPRRWDRHPYVAQILDNVWLGRHGIFRVFHGKFWNLDDLALELLSVWSLCGWVLFAIGTYLIEKQVPISPSFPEDRDRTFALGLK